MLTLLQIQPRLMIGYGRCRWLRFKTLQKQFRTRGLAEPQTMSTEALENPSANKRAKQATIWPMVFRQLATDARALGTNSKHCGSDAMRLIGCCIDCLHFLDDISGTARSCRDVCSCWSLDTYTSDRHCYNFHVLASIAVGFVEAQPGFLQLFLTQTLVKCTSLDSSRCVAYSGIRFMVIWAASEKLQQDE